MQFEFMTSNRIVFGPGTVQKAIDAVQELGGGGKLSLLAVTGSDPHRFDGVFSKISEAGADITFFPVSGEPDTDMITAGKNAAEEKGCTAVISIGGGSVVDAGKALAAAITNPGDLLDYLEVIGKGKPLLNRPACFIAVPTTSGTGAEVTKNAVLTSKPHKVKVSMRSPLMLPDLAVIDPELTLNLPKDITAQSGMDALTQLIEAYVSAKATPMTDALSREGLVRCACALVPAYKDGGNLTARSDMALSALFSGLALANGGLGAVHGIAGPLGGYKAVPHGVICARLLPHVFRKNAGILAQSGDPADMVKLSRFREVAAILTGNMDATPGQGADKLDELAQTLELKSMASYGFSSADFEVTAEAALKASSMKGNPVQPTKDDIIDLLEKEASV